MGWGGGIEKGGGVVCTKDFLMFVGAESPVCRKKCSKAIKLFSSFRPPMPMFLVDIRPLSPPPLFSAADEAEKGTRYQNSILQRHQRRRRRRRRPVALAKAERGRRMRGGGHREKLFVPSAGILRKGFMQEFVFLQMFAKKWK